ncbi:Uncharacterised protein [uncultured archaeon]|nr:Uncharacterised protein [uncultured archaeon]
MQGKTMGTIKKTALIVTSIAIMGGAPGTDLLVKKAIGNTKPIVENTNRGAGSDQKTLAQMTQSDNTSNKQDGAQKQLEQKSQITNDNVQPEKKQQGVKKVSSWVKAHPKISAMGGMCAAVVLGAIGFLIYQNRKDETKKTGGLSENVLRMIDFSKPKKGEEKPAEETKPEKKY